MQILKSMHSFQGMSFFSVEIIYLDGKLIEEGKEILGRGFSFNLKLNTIALSEQHLKRWY